MKERKFSTYQIVFVAVMAALVCVVTFFRFPLLGSKVHFANAMCLLSGMLFGPMLGGLAAGLGSMLYDALFGGYDFINCLVTFVSKFLMAAICAWIAFGGKEEGKGKHARLVVGSVVGALSYVARSTCSRRISSSALSMATPSMRSSSRWAASFRLPSLTLSSP